MGGRRGTLSKVQPVKPDFPMNHSTCQMQWTVHHQTPKLTNNNCRNMLQVGKEGGDSPGLMNHSCAMMDWSSCPKPGSSQQIRKNASQTKGNSQSKKKKEKRGASYSWKC